jgi:hypothetical protein
MIGQTPLAVLALVLLVAGCGQQDGVGAARRRPAVDAARIAVLQEDGTLKLLPECSPVQAFHVGLVEAGLPEFVRQEFARQDLQRRGASGAKVCSTDDYVRQYMLPCVTGQDPGAKEGVVRVQLIHIASPHVRSGEWLKDLIAIVGGGDDYVSLSYDLRTRRYGDLQVNDPY